MSVLSDLYSTSGRKAKEEIITRYKNNDKLKKVLEYSMSSDVVLGISEKSFEKILDKSEFFYTPEQEAYLWTDDLDWSKTDSHFDSLKDIIEHILIQPTPTPNNAVIESIKNVFDDCNRVERYWFYRMFIQNLNIGIGPKLVNKVFGPLIHQYTPMLADSGIEKFDKWEPTDEYYVDTKIDGLRLTLFFTPDSIRVKTRSGKRFWPLEVYFNEHLLHHKYITEFIKAINGEFIRDANDDTLGFAIDSEILDSAGTWEATVSLVNVNNLEVTKLDENDKSVPAFYLKCFDLVNLNPFKPEHFNEQVKTLPYKRRRELLENFVSNVPDDLPFKFFTLTPLTIVKTLDEAQAKAREYIDNGFEGAVVKHPTHMYICDRKHVWLKIKDIQTLDGVITDVIPGDASGKYNSMAAKLMVKVDINGTEVNGTIGTGFKDEDRKYLWENKEKVVGKIVEFTMLSKTVNDNFRSGVYKGIRIDKENNENAQ